MELNRQAISAIERYIENKKLKTMVNYFGMHRELREDLLELTKGAMAYPFPEYASWVLSHTGNKRDYWQPYLSEIIEIFLYTENQTILRNIAKTLLKLGVPEEIESQVFDRCLEIISKNENKVAAQVNCMHMLTPIVKKYPELKDEVIQVLNFNSKDKSIAYMVGMRDFIKGKRKR